MTKASGGECDTTIINNFFYNLPKNINSIFVIKSTIPIGTTKNIKNIRKDLKIVHNPEFLTALNAVGDFRNAERNIVGGDKSLATIVGNFISSIIPDINNIYVSSDESEAIKYFSNCFLATKVAYFNMVFDISEKMNLDYNNLILGICTDSRINFSHVKVPGHDGQRGFGGTCFPKDISSLIDIYEKNNLNCDILKSVWNYNKSIRKYWDWKDNKSAVLMEDKK
jgi:UDPglucose 6-dehydrogenase